MAVVQALMNAGNDSSRGGTSVHAPALSVTYRPLAVARGMMDQQVAHPLQHHACIVMRRDGGIGLGEHREGAAIPATDQIATAPI